MMTLQNNLVYVDSIYGSDATGQVENEDLPFATLTAAQTTVLAQLPDSVGWLIIVRPGFYLDANLGANNINWYFQKGVILTPIGGPLFRTATLALNQGFAVFGEGRVQLSPSVSAASALLLDNAASPTNLSFTFFQIDTTNGILTSPSITLNNASLKLYVQQISTEANNTFILANGGQLTADVTQINHNGDVFLQDTGNGALVIFEVQNMTLNDTGFDIAAGSLTFNGQNIVSAAPAFIITQTGFGAITINSVITTLDPLLTLTVTGPLIPTAPVTTLTVENVQATFTVIDWQSGNAVVSIKEIVGNSSSALVGGTGLGSFGGTLDIDGINWTNSGPIINLSAAANTNTAKLFANFEAQAFSSGADTVTLTGPGTWSLATFKGRYQSSSGIVFNLTVGASPIIFQSAVAITGGSTSVSGSMTNGKVYGYFVINKPTFGATFTTTTQPIHESTAV
jgi:hypothetical protein